MEFIHSIIAGLAGYAFVGLTPWPVWVQKNIIQGKPLNCYMCMAFWFGLIFSILDQNYFAAPIVGFASMYFAVLAYWIEYKLRKP